MDEAPLFPPPKSEARDWEAVELVLDVPLEPVRMLSRLLILSDWVEVDEVELLEPLALLEPLLCAAISADKSCDENCPAAETPIGEIGAALASWPTEPAEFAASPSKSCRVEAPDEAAPPTADCICASRELIEFVAICIAQPPWTARRQLADLAAG